MVWVHSFSKGFTQVHKVLGCSKWHGKGEVRGGHALIGGEQNFSFTSLCGGNSAGTRQFGGKLEGEGVYNCAWFPRWCGWIDFKIQSHHLKFLSCRPCHPRYWLGQQSGQHPTKQSVSPRLACWVVLIELQSHHGRCSGIYIQLAMSTRFEKILMPLWPGVSHCGAQWEYHRGTECWIVSCMLELLEM